jgi:hypothetical protein
MEAVERPEVVHCKISRLVLFAQVKVDGEDDDSRAALEAVDVDERPEAEEARRDSRSRARAAGFVQRPEDLGRGRFRGALDVQQGEEGNLDPATGDIGLR